MRALRPSRGPVDAAILPLDRERTTFNAVVLLPAAVLVVAVVLRFAFLGSSDLFRDEAASWLLAQYDWGAIVPHMAAEPYPPLYPFVLKGWIGVLGDGPTALRALSALAGLGVVALTWAWAREAIGRGMAVVAALILALSPLALMSARDVRMYALETFFATAAWWLLWRMLVDGSPSARRRSPARLPTIVLVAVAVTGELWTMPTGIVTLALQGMATAVVMVAGGPGGLRRGGLAAIPLAIGLIPFVPWLINLMRVGLSEQAYWTPPPTIVTLGEGAGALLVGWDASPAWLATPILGALGGVGLVMLWRRRDPAALATAVCASAGIALILAWWAFSFLKSAFDPRYLGAALPPLAIAMAVGAERAYGWLRGRFNGRVVWAAGGALLVLLSSGTAVFAAGWMAQTGTAPAEAAMRELVREMRPGDVLLAVDARSYFPLAYVSGRSSHPITLPGPLWFWDDGSEPAFFGSGLIDASRSVLPRTAERDGRLTIPGLAPNGSLWMVPLTNDDYELGTFAPLAKGEVVEVSRTLVRGGGNTIPVCRLHVVKPAS